MTTPACLSGSPNQLRRLSGAPATAHRLEVGRRLIEQPAHALPRRTQIRCLLLQFPVVRNNGDRPTSVNEAHNSGEDATVSRTGSSRHCHLVREFERCPRWCIDNDLPFGEPGVTGEPEGGRRDAGHRKAADRNEDLPRSLREKKVRVRFSRVHGVDKESWADGKQRPQRGP